MKQVYQTPDFDVSAYELDDIITISIGTGPVEGGDSGWVEIWRSRSNRSDLLTIISRARFALLCFFVPYLVFCDNNIFCILFCAYFFVCHMRSFPHTPARPFHYSFSTSVFVFLLFSLPCREQASPKQLEAFCLPWKGRWVAAGNSEGFHRNLKRTCVTFNPLLPPLKREWVAEGKPEGFCGVIWNLNRKQITF